MSDLPRVSPPKVFPGAARASRPKPENGGAADAHRQLGFVLGEEADTVVDGLELEAALAQASTGAKFRNHTVASVLATWSREWLLRLQALHAAEWGNYVGAIALVRDAVEMQAASAHLLATEAAGWQQWLTNGGITADHERHATGLRTGALRLDEALANDELLARLHWVTSRLASPAFAATLFVSAPGSDTTRVAVTFGDRDFHYGLAELVIGWLLELSGAQLQRIRDSGFFGEGDGDAIERFERAARRAIDRKDRCTATETEDDGETRLLVNNWRRQPATAPRRFLL